VEKFLTVPCPVCQAEAGQPCVELMPGDREIGVHQERANTYYAEQQRGDNS
jgi:hypothetical protein